MGTLKAQMNSILRFLGIVSLMVLVVGCQVLEVVLGPADGVIVTRKLAPGEMQIADTPASGGPVAVLPEMPQAQGVTPEATALPEVEPPAAPPAVVALAEPEASLPVAFNGPKPQRLSMPVPVFPQGVVFDPMIPGWVDFDITIDGEGRVVAAMLIESSHDELVAPAQEALMRAVYKVVGGESGGAVFAQFRDRVEF